VTFWAWFWPSLLPLVKLARMFAALVAWSVGVKA
jgi:hypothetical protein